MVTQEQIPSATSVRFHWRQREIIAAALERYPQANNQIVWVLREALECIAKRDHLLEASV